MTERRSLIGLSPEELESALQSVGVEAKPARMRARQLWNWIYVHGARDFAAMTQSGQGFPQRRWRSISPWRGRRSSPNRSPTTAPANGCCAPGRASNSRPSIFRKRTAARCASPRQVGCTLNCRFCHTGTQKLVRNLTPDEIVGQMMIARDALGDWPSTAPRTASVTNVVMMGMGEPLYNFDNVKAALAIVTDGDGLALSQAPRHALHRRRGADDRARGRGDRLGPRDLAACGARRNARRDRADQQEISASRNCWRPAAPIPAPPMRGASPSNM